ncbi:hypothetical protein AOQ73_21240 [Bradyrhizobium pachyrhizi]|nr:hypothetical protein AOQ73_21240 [Bradyrhizobium pachyrhizi]
MLFNNRPPRFWNRGRRDVGPATDADFLTKLWQNGIEFFLLNRLGSIFCQVRCQQRDTGLW